MNALASSEKGSSKGSPLSFSFRNDRAPFLQLMKKPFSYLKKCLLERDRVDLPFPRETDLSMKTNTGGLSCPIRRERTSPAALKDRGHRSCPVFVSYKGEGGERGRGGGWLK